MNAVFIFLISLLIVVASVIFSNKYNLKDKKKNKTYRSIVSDDVSDFPDDVYDNLFYDINNPCDKTKYTSNKQQYLGKDYWVTVNGVNYDYDDFLHKYSIPIDEKYDNYLDWATKQNRLNKVMVNPIERKQGSCGSCYAFGTIILLEFIMTSSNENDCTTRTINALSVQQILDCTSSRTDVCIKEKPSKGCSGGDPADIGMTLFTRSYNICFEMDYPYECVNCVEDETLITRYPAERFTPFQFIADCSSKKISKCSDTKGITIPKLDTIVFNIGPGQEKDIKKILYYFGPLSFTYKKSKSELYQNYGEEYFKLFFSNNSGVADSAHNNVLTGWNTNIYKKILFLPGTNSIADYSDDINRKLPLFSDKCWIVKNSWGNNWGYNGYILFPRDNNYLNITKLTCFRLSRPICDLPASNFTVMKNPKTVDNTTICEFEIKAYLPGITDIQSDANYTSYSLTIVQYFMGEDNIKQSNFINTITTNTELSQGGIIVTQNRNNYFSSSSCLNSNSNWSTDRWFYYKLNINTNAIDACSWKVQFNIIYKNINYTNELIFTFSTMIFIYHVFTPVTNKRKIEVLEEINFKLFATNRRDVVVYDSSDNIVNIPIRPGVYYVEQDIEEISNQYCVISYKSFKFRP
jgi:hypothetical protein